MPQMVAWYLAILVWEALTIPAVSHQDSWRGVHLSIIALPLSAALMARQRGRDSYFFIYGCAGALLFVMRFLGMDRFSLWLEYQAPSDSVIVFSWIAFSLGMGAVCLGAHRFARSLRDEARGPDQPDPSARPPDSAAPPMP